MFEREWPILLVDDDPDVLVVSTLAMRHFQVDGRPIKLHTAVSKAEAIELLEGPLGGHLFPYIAVAFIDVVMETDTAGLELCKYIREAQKNRLTQLYIRTGQPGVAPEREVIDRYDVNGYFTKVELTEDKLYSLVKAGVRQFDFTNMALLEFDVVTQAIAASDSWDNLARSLSGTLQRMPLDRLGKSTREYHLRVCMLVGDRLLAGTGYTEAEALAERDRLMQLGMQPVGTSGDASYVLDGNDFLVRVPASDTNDEAFHLANLAGPPGLPDVLLLRLFTRAIATLAKRVTAPTREPAAA